MATISNINQSTRDRSPEDDLPAEFNLDGDQSRRLAGYWKDQLDDYNNQNRRWHKRGRTIEKRYRDERNRTDEEGQRRYNSLWSNIEILFPALYARVPLPVAERRFKDKDPVGRGAAQILERSLRNEIEINGYGYAIDCAVLDYLLPGRGTVWVRYEPEFGEGPSIPSDSEMDLRDDRGELGEDEEESEDEEEKSEEEKLASTGDRVIRESAPVDYIQWTDFFTFPAKARTWSEVIAVGKRVFMTRDQMVRRFGKKIGKAIPMERDDRERRRQNETIWPEDEAAERGQVYEIWNKHDETVYWVAEGYDKLCDRQHDPLELENFFPCPRPLYANRTNNTIIPVPDYMQYQDQAIQIDELTQRVAMLAKACKVAGCYNAAVVGLKRLLDESVENELIPVDSWAMFAEKGGIAGSISFVPLKEVMETIDKLTIVKEKTMVEMDRLTGITDIMRGTSDARETMGAQRLKTNGAGSRIQKRQSEVARFARDTVRLMADVMCKHFSAQSLLEASGALYEEGLGPDDLEAMGGQLMGAPMAPPPTPAALPPGAGGLSSSLGSPAPTNNVVPMRPPVPGAPPPPPGMPPQGAAPPPPGGAPPPPGGAPPPGMVPGSAAGFGGMMPPSQPEIPPQIASMIRIIKSLALLRNEKLRGFRVDIEVDSTIYSDEQQEKSDRTEFLGAVTKFLQTAMQMASANPEMTPLLGKFLQFGVRGFKIGRDLETAIEDFCEQAEKTMKQKMLQPPQPNPEQIKQQTEMFKVEAAAEQTKQKIAGDQQKAIADMTGERQKAQAEVTRQNLENQGEIANAQLDLQGKSMDREMRMMEMRIEEARMNMEMRKMEIEMYRLQHPPPVEIKQPPPTGGLGSK